jgi:hypothetical protein
MTGKLKTVLWHWKLQRRLQKSAAASRHDFVLPDGMDGWVHIEWLLLRHDGIHVLETLEGTGQLIAGDNLLNWTLVGRRRFVFPSPLPELERKQAAVKLLVNKIPVQCYVIMGDQLKLARAHPRSVIAFSELPERLRPVGGASAVPPDYAQLWDRLMAAARTPSTPSGLKE